MQNHPAMMALVPGDGHAFAVVLGQTGPHLVLQIYTLPHCPHFEDLLQNTQWDDADEQVLAQPVALDSLINEHGDYYNQVPLPRGMPSALV